MTYSIAVRCTNLVKIFGAGSARVHALRGLDLNVRYGELFMLVGPSGCGKTTLISIIAAILAPDSGTCEVMGQDLSSLDEDARARYRRNSLGFVFQSYNLLPALTALENVSVPLFLNGATEIEAKLLAREALSLVDLEKRQDSLPGALSGGQQQRVAIARAIAHQPRLIVCDEPTSNLDHESGQSVMSVLSSVAKRPDRALIVVTHDERTFGFADRIGRMDDGLIVEMTEDHMLEPVE